jgi:hypothetical protein
MFRFDEGWTYRMPAHFLGGPGDGMADTLYDDVTSVAIAYTTDEEQLSRYVPDAFEILEPVISVNYQRCPHVQWMGGAGYNLIAVATPARHLSSGVAGAFILVIWENRTEPILHGREETGMPKVYADIPDHRLLDGHLTAEASYDGRLFVEIQAQLGSELTAGRLAAMNDAGRVDQLGWRYIPNLGRPGAALSQATLFPVVMENQSGREAVGTVTWTKADQSFGMFNSPIVDALADLPILEYRMCVLTKGQVHLRGDLARELG